MRERILITGAGGRVGQQLVPLLREQFALRLLDLKALPPEQDDEVTVGDIGDLKVFEQACQGVTALVHLAAVPDEDDFMTRLLPANIVGAYHAFEAARQAGVKKVIFASTCQTVLGYGRGVPVTTDMPPRPCTVYASTKLFGEALGRYYSDQHGLSVICIRIGWFQPYDSPLLRSQPKLRGEWCSPRDLAQLIGKSLASPVPFAVFFALSKNPGLVWDLANAKEMVGFEPEDDWTKLNLPQASV